ncbi:MAG: RnfABCDGE type electron transport complex subunit D [Muribaculaceae bacterium]|nr:RnfABCDGE type electron transport complex subunit D [Muribaculaceae bacterium]
MDNMRLVVSGSPHIHSTDSVNRRMWGVVIALMPAVAYSVYLFGLGALVVLLTSVLGCVITEYLIQRYMLGGKTTITNGSAVITGLLLAMNLPSNLPIWIILIGCVVAIGLGKYAFGGLGQNIFNPAILGRVFLLISFPQQMTSWPLPLVNRGEYLDATTGATYLGQMKMEAMSTADSSTGASAVNEIATESLTWIDALIGNMGGSLGEMSAIALIIGGVFMLLRGIISWHIPVSIIGTVMLFAWGAGVDPVMSVLSGGVMLGAIFMATDYVTSPMTRRGMVMYGMMIGIITMIIRLWGAYPEGVSFAILIMNGFTPLINKFVRPRKFGERRVN